MRDNFDGYKADNTVNINSPEIARLAYGPQMNAHIDAIKAQRKSTSNTFKNDVGLEFADHIRFKDKAPISMCLGGSKTKLFKVKPKFCFICKERVYVYHVVEGRVYGNCHKADAHQPMVEQAARRPRQTKGVGHGS